ncbi:MAG: hypothetical protein JWP59_4769 [Massilia sp.]|nr:hypothetical protein [Massilia sp.]
MRGLDILARSMSNPTRGSGKGFQFGNSWQYHSRSDRHSKIACWSILFDLMLRSSLLREQVANGRAACGINHTMTDFRTGRKKDLDLVVCRSIPARATDGPRSFRQMVDAYTIVLDDVDRAALASLPDIPVGEAAQVMMALEAKAAMTEFSKARPRLYDELNSSHLTVHGSDEAVIAAGFVMVNVASSFVSPDRNKHPLATTPAVVNEHRQPAAAASVLEKLRELPRRARASGNEGFDALAIVLVNCRNDGSPVTVVTDPPAPASADAYHYGQFISRLEMLYATRFSAL